MNKECEVMIIKTGKERLASVTFSYEGSDPEFTQFLKMLIHDFLKVEKDEDNTGKIST